MKFRAFSLSAQISKLSLLFIQSCKQLLTFLAKNHLKMLYRQEARAKKRNRMLLAWGSDKG